MNLNRKRDEMWGFQKPEVTDAYTNFFEFVNDDNIVIIYDEDVYGTIKRTTKRERHGDLLTYEMSYNKEDSDFKVQGLKPIFNGAEIIWSKVKPRKVLILCPILIKFNNSEHLFREDLLLDYVEYIPLRVTTKNTLKYTIDLDDIYKKISDKYLNNFSSTYEISIEDQLIYTITLPETQDLPVLIDNIATGEHITVDTYYQFNGKTIEKSQPLFDYKWLDKFTYKPNRKNPTGYVSENKIHIVTEFDFDCYDPVVVKVLKDYSDFTGVNNMEEFLNQYPSAYIGKSEELPKLEIKRSDEYNELYNRFLNWDL